MFKPEVPLTADILAMDEGWERRVVNHIMTDKRRHFISFSLRPSPALHYATKGRERCGYLVTCRLPDMPTATYGGFQDAPAWWQGVDDSLWVDPRRLTMQLNETWWHSMWCRARVDDEILLAVGTVRPISPVKRVCPADCDPRFIPWKDFGERIRFTP